MTNDERLWWISHDLSIARVNAAINKILAENPNVDETMLQESMVKMYFESFHSFRNRVPRDRLD